jgi:glycosyltransferase involved in cell wall biosynthesis
MKIDLHCHSKHSERPTLWIMQKLNCPESFTEPLDLYRQARERGMGQVTITDHNVIDGALEIAHLPDTIIGCEYTTYFPEDRCKVHVLVYGMTEAQHRDITEARENIHDFVRYIQDNNLRHVCAHPLFWINDRLTVDHVEQLLLLFKNWEWNGDMLDEMNQVMVKLVEGLTPLKIAELADKHGIEPTFDQPWRKNFTAGSDDHGSLHLARTFTEVPGAQTWEEFWLGVEQSKAKIRCQPASPEMFARNIYGIGYQFYNSKFGLDRYRHNDVLLRFLDRSLKADTDGADPWISRVQLMLTRRFRGSTQISANSSLFEMARVEAEKLIQSDPQLVAIMQKGTGNAADFDQIWAEFVSEVSNRLLAHIGSHTIERLQHARLFDLFHSAGSSAALYTLIAPYFISYSLFARERTWSCEVWKHFNGADEGNPIARAPRIAHFTDTFDEVNGVAVTLQQELCAAQRSQRDLTIVTCDSGERPFRAGVHCVPALSSYSLPDYPELAINIPPFLKLLKHCYDEGYTHIHVATPGTMGLAGLAIARILHLPVTGTYHTAFPQYAKTLTEDGYVEHMMWTGITWFYQQLDAVYVPSRATGAELVDRGLSASKIRHYPRGVDTDFFTPAKRNDELRRELGAGPDTTVLLYVGRVSKEKNLAVLTDAMGRIGASGNDAMLVVVGDGPYRKGMEEKLADRRVVFTGYKGGDELPELFASADVFVFPSTTDTFGNVVLEAQASGLPVIASDIGGPKENIEQEETGLIVPEISGDAFAEAIESLLRHPERRRRMGQHAREAMESRSIDASFNRLWEMYIGDELERPAEREDLLETMAHLIDSPVVAK